MILTHNSTSIDIGEAQYPSGAKSELIQVKERSASGVPHTEDYNVEINEMSFSFVDMKELIYLALVDFHLNVVLGMSEEFTLDDDKGNSYTVNFTSPIIDFKNTSFELWSGKFNVEKAQ